jgi:hypothetical protein
MGKIPSLAIIGIVVVLAIGLSCAAFFAKMRPMQADLAVVQKNLDDETAKANEKGQADTALAAAQIAWQQAQATLGEKMARRSIPVSFGEPVMAMIALWYEYREDLPPRIEKFIQSTGCVLLNGATFPAPKMTPPAAPAGGFLQVPEGQTISLQVRGSLENIEKLYRALPSFPRVVTVGNLSLSGQGDNLTCTLPLTFYLLVEVPPGLAMAAAAAPAGGVPSGAPGGASAGGPPGAPKASGSKAAAKPEKEEDTGGVGKKAKEPKDE